MANNIFNERIGENINTWRAEGKYTYIDIANRVLMYAAKNLCYPNSTMQQFSFSTKTYTAADVIYVMDCFGIKYSSAEIVNQIVVTL